MSNFSKYKYKLLDHLSYEQQFEEEIKFKQMMLVIICGCTLVSLLSFHIYYNYYLNYNFIDITNLEIFNELEIEPNNNKKRALSSNLVNNAFDSSRDGYYTATRVISESTNYTQPTITATSSTSEAVLSTMNMRYRQKYAYDAESGILSTVTSSSCFSSSYEKQFIDNLVDLIQNRNTSLFTQSNLVLHNNQTSEQNINQSLYDKVYSWFMKSNSSSLVDLNLQRQNKLKSRNSLISQQSTTADCSFII